VQREALTPNDFASLDELEHRLLAFQSYYEQIAAPFEWKFTRRDLEEILRKMNSPEPLALTPALA